MTSDSVIEQILVALKELKTSSLALVSTAPQAPVAPAAPAGSLPVTLGFGSPPRARYIYANRQYADCLWYFWNGGKSTHEPIEHHALTGYIEKLEIEKKEFRGRTEEKLNLTVRAEQKYIIQAGVETIFGKGLIHTLAKLPAEAYKNPVTVSVEPGNSDEVLFCRIYNPANGNSVYSPFPEDADWPALIQRAMGKINPAPAAVAKN